MGVKNADLFTISSNFLFVNARGCAKNEITFMW